MSKLILSSALLAITVAVSPAVASEVLPLEQNNWDNPAFVSRFVGSFGFDTEKNPSINSDEKKLFDQLASIIPVNPNQAIDMLKAAITSDSSGALDYTLANLYFQTGKTKEAIASYHAALKKYPNFVRAHQNLGILLVQDGEFEPALKQLLLAAEGGGLNGSLMGLIGYCYLNGGKMASALDAYRLALIFEPESRDWKLGKAQCLVNIGSYKEAIAMLDEMITGTPEDSNLLMLQANAFLSDGDPMKAAGNLETVRALGKANSTSLVLLGDILVNNGNPDLAVEYYQEAVKQGGLPADRLVRMVRILAARDAWAEADSVLASIRSASADKLSPKEKMELLNLEAQVALGKDEDERAAGILEKVVSSDPLNGRALLLLANYHAKTGSVDRAELYYDRAASVPETEAEALIQHARLLVGQRSFAKAADLLSRAQSIHPQANVAAFLTKVQAAAEAMR